MLFFNNSIGFVSASDQTVYYARVMHDNVFLYKSALEIDDYSNVYFILPKTYFVELTGEVNSKFFQVNYLNFSGYVKKECVQTIVGIPQTPYLNNISFRIFSEQSRDMRSEPNTDSGTSGQIAYLPLLTKNLTYYGSIVGQSLIEGRTNIWYYCKYSAEKDYFGYIYSDFCDEMTTITDNTEEVTYTTSPNFNSNKTENNAIKVEDNTTSIIIAILCLPAIIFAFMVIKNSKIIKKESTKNGEIKDY